jgi:cephalosporin hydroxylase
MDIRTITELSKLLGSRRPKSVYEIGSLNINGSVRTLFRDAKEYHGIDIVEGRDVDTVGYGSTYEPPFRPDCVVCCEVFEHTPDTEAIVNQMAKLVVPGGIVLISCAGTQRPPHSAVDGKDLPDDEYYAGIDHLVLTEWLKAAGLVNLRLIIGCLPDTTDPDTQGVHDIYMIGQKPIGALANPYDPVTMGSSAANAPPADIATPKQLTVVEQGKTTLEELAQSVLDTRAKYGEVLQAYHEVWYNAPHTWSYTQFLNIGVMKSPNDMWIYQDIMVNHKPQTVIETGTYQGGSALWLASLADLMGIDTKIFTIDIKDFRRCTHPRITFIRGDSTDPGLAADLAKQVEGSLLVILDADHSAEHVRKELELYAPLCKVGDWLVVEDTNIAWPGEQGDRGAAGGLADYLAQHPGEWQQDILSERFLLTMNPGGWMRRVGVYREFYYEGELQKQQLESVK